MSFTGFLKTFAKDLLKGVTYASAIVQGIDPLVQNTAAAKPINTIQSELATIGSLVTITETVASAITSQNTGPQKLAAVVPYASSLIQQSELLAGKQVADEAGFEEGVTDVVNGVVKILNSVKKTGSTSTVPVTPTVSTLPLPSVTPPTP